ncbi:MAG: hypothetical protein U1A78_19555 [Polyangia bacterium]
MLCIARAAPDGSGYQIKVLDGWTAAPTSLLPPSACSIPPAAPVVDAIKRSKIRSVSTLPTREQLVKSLMPAHLKKPLRRNLADTLLPCGPHLVIALPRPRSDELLVASRTGLLRIRPDFLNKVQKEGQTCSELAQLDPAWPDIEFVSVNGRGELALGVLEGRFSVYLLTDGASTIPLPWRLDLVGQARDAAWGPDSGQLATISGSSVQIWDFSAASRLDLDKLGLFATACLPEAERVASPFPAHFPRLPVAFCPRPISPARAWRRCR